ncbi:MAG: ABC transporter ATP-binding protein [Clostridia bacterium]|nr:ABC transporter ATP-binding protein [Clostridia bacterium]
MKHYYFTTQQLTVGYDGVPLIRDITIEIERGEIVTLIGPNGSGKSTILKSVTRQLKALGGRVFIGEEELRSLSHGALATKLAVVLTERMRPELMTCRDIVATGRYPYTGRLGILSAADEAKVEAAMAAVRVADIQGRDFNAISDGQRQRVLLARAICQAPEIIVLDEPTSFLDIRHKLELLTLLRDMAKREGITVVMSLHEIDLAQKISDRVICVKGDHIARCGAPEEVFDAATIRELYAIDQGGFDPTFGSVELPRAEGEPEALVLSACGTGIPVYRRLQRQGVPFAAGILYENDVDYHLARALAAEVISERPFMPISDEAFNRALEWMGRCPRVINAGVRIGETNRRMAELVAAAREREGYEEM